MNRPTAPWLRGGLGHNVAALNRSGNNNGCMHERFHNLIAGRYLQFHPSVDTCLGHVPIVSSEVQSSNYKGHKNKTMTSWTWWSLKICENVTKNAKRRHISYEKSYQILFKYSSFMTTQQTGKENVFDQVLIAVKIQYFLINFLIVLFGRN